MTILQTYRRWADFSGRSTRREYWLFVATHALAVVLAAILEQAAATEEQAFGMPPIAATVAAIAFVPFLAVHMRRLHDAGASNGLALATLVPVIGWVVMLIYLLKPSRPDEEGVVLSAS